MGRSRRGGFVIIVAVSLTVLTGMVALAFDIGYARLMRARVEMAMEASSHAAAKELDFTEDGLDRARDAAISMASRTTVMGATLAVGNDDVDFGVWDDATHSFASDTDPANINAVHINTSVNVPLMFGAISFADSSMADGFNIGVNTVATSGAPGGASSVTCGLPVAVPLCAVDNNGDGVVDSGLQGSKFDTGGCAGTFESGYKQAFLATTGSAFSYTRARNSLTDCEDMGLVQIDDAIGSEVSIKLDNTSFNLVMDRLNTEMGTHGSSLDSRWSGGTPTQMTTSRVDLVDYGSTIEAPVMVVDVGTSYCTGGTSTTTTTPPTSGTVVGFVWGAIYDGRKRCYTDAGAAIASCLATSLTCSTTTPAGTVGVKRWGRLRFRVDSSVEYLVGTASGGDDWGVTAPGTVRLIPNPE